MNIKQFVIVAGFIVLSANIFLPGIVFAQVAATTTTITTTTIATSSDPNASVAAAVQSYFADIPIMISIAKCESGPRQFKSDGTPLLGGTGTMVGIFQLDETIHYAPAMALGYDINTIAGNMGYARYLYGIDGTEPWISSFGCWGNASAELSATSSPTTTTVTTSTTVVTASSSQLTLNLSLGTIDPQVLILQQLLNTAGFTLATSGPGSPGNETDKFGALTYAALKNFQCTEGIACSGSESSNGYGLLNAATRAALAVAVSNSSSSTVTSTTTVATDDNDPAEMAELQSRIAALLAIVAQLQSKIASMKAGV
jgi:hypothetical protein